MDGEQALSVLFEPGMRQSCDIEVRQKPEAGIRGGLKTNIPGTVAGPGMSNLDSWIDPVVTDP
jgi:hypothetical protein